MIFNIFELRSSSILYLYAQRESIQTDPDYQRMGEVWALYKKQLLIDSILNEFDIPKIYFHDLSEMKRNGDFRYAIIDGKQRLEAIWSFINGDFPLSMEFEYLHDSNVDAAGLTYSELSTEYPELKQMFDATTLSVFVVQTSDIDLIEDMFSRLNEAVPLNAAEKRNAYGGPLPKIVREVSKHDFFAKNLKISNRRFQHRDLTAKMLYLIHNKNVLDTKKVYLDNFFIEHKEKRTATFNRAIQRTSLILDHMNDAFTKNDSLLSSSGMVVVYFLLFDTALKNDWQRLPTRSRLIKFDKERAKNRTLAEEDITKADYDLLEFDRLTQTPNDAYAIKFRLGLLTDYFES